MRLELLLAHADDGTPVLPEGLQAEALQTAPRPVPVDLPENLWDESGEPNLLPRQRWGLVVPKGPQGKRLLELVAPLRRAREEAQGGEPARVYCVRSGMDTTSAMHWKKGIFRDEEVPESERPRYLLVLGDLDEVSLELQQVLSTDAYVGRLAFPTEAGYESYVEKVLRWERMPAPDSKTRLLVYTAKDGSEATRLGLEVLTGPGLEACRGRQRKGQLPDVELLELVDDGSTHGEQLLSCAAQQGPSVLFSLSHGLASPKEGWNSPDEQHALRGALLLPGGRQLTGTEVASRPFLPGGIWFCFACFSAGTPGRSAYTPWLRQLSAVDPRVAQALEGVLLREEERPSIAALPQAALANPQGPLAVMGHVDLAWATSFNDKGRGTPSRFFSVLEALVEGRRAGPAMRSLLKHATEASTDLMGLYYKEEVARQGDRSSAVDPLELARLWMLRQDLANYVLLGDPAVRLPLASR